VWAGIGFVYWFFPYVLLPHYLPSRHLVGYYEGKKILVVNQARGVSSKDADCDTEECSYKNI